MVHELLGGRVARVASGALVHSATKGQLGFSIESWRPSKNAHTGVYSLDQTPSCNTQVTCER